MRSIHAADRVRHAMAERWAVETVGPDVADLVSGVGDRHLDHAVDQPGSACVGQPVTVGDQAQVPGPRRDVREPLAFGDVVVVQLGVQPAGLGELDLRVDGAGRLPVDQRRAAVGTHEHVPRRGVAVSERGGRTEVTPHHPPHRTIGRAERGGRAVQVMQGGADPRQDLGRPRAGCAVAPSTSAISSSAPTGSRASLRHDLGGQDRAPPLMCWQAGWRGDRLG